MDRRPKLGTPSSDCTTSIRGESNKPATTKRRRRSDSTVRRSASKSAFVAKKDNWFLAIGISKALLWAQAADDRKGKLQVAPSKLRCIRRRRAEAIGIKS